ncbi:ATP-binding protein [Aliikangiella maris]|uniref:ATP-binding protein n=2 Tax=Aliikangiella maris TaxID=3162458 RepID=A0ABV3MNM3_9GAMM
MKKNIYIFILAIYTFFLGSSFFASADQPTNVVSITEDSNGYMYFVTQMGVIRYDGYKYINLAEISDLPQSWSGSAVYQEKTNTLYIAFFKEGVWTLNLTTYKTKKISSLDVDKLALSNTHLMARVHRKLYLFDLHTLSQKKHELTDVIDIAALQNQHYAITKNGLYKINGQHSWLVRSFQTTTAQLALLNHRLAYSTDYDLTLLSLSDEKTLTTRTFTDPITAMTPYQQNLLAIAYGSKVDILDTALLETVKASVNQLEQISYLLYEDKQGNLWSTDKIEFEVIDQHSTVLRLPKPSRYNEVQMVNNQLWLGTEHGLYYLDKGIFHPLADINEQFPKLERRINKILYQKDKPIIFATTKGAYKFEDNKLSQIYDGGYVISASYIDDELLLSTTYDGIVAFDNNFNPIDYSAINNVLPHLEVVSIKKINNILYIMSSGGLVEKNQNEIKVTYISPYNLIDIFTIDGNLYLTSWGGGLFKHSGNQWQPIKSPSNLGEAVEYFDEVLISSANGLYRFKNEEFALVPNTAKQLFYGITIDEHIAYAAGRTNLISIDFFNSPSLNAPRFTQLPTEDTPYNQTVTISANCFDYLNGNIIQYQYQLNDGNWIDMHNGSVQISYLNIGRHNVQVRASYNGTNWLTTPVKSFYVSGPWYYSDWFIIVLTILSSIGLLFGLIAFAVIFKVNRQKNKVFKEVSQQQTKQGLLETYSNLVAAKNILHSKNKMAANSGLMKVDQAVEKIESLLDNYSVLSAMGNSNLDHSLQGLEALIIAQNVSHEFQVSVSKRCGKETRNTIFYIAHTLITNSLKHAKAKFIQMSISCDNKQIKICVQDDGIGIKFTDHTFNFGVGIATLKNIAYERKGKIKFRSYRRGKSKGTFVTITLPYLPSDIPVNNPLSKTLSFN